VKDDGTSPDDESMSKSSKDKVHYSSDLSTQAFSSPPKPVPWMRAQDEIQAYGGLRSFADFSPSWEGGL
jgi:hypothetical protein